LKEELDLSNKEVLKIEQRIKEYLKQYEDNLEQDDMEAASAMYADALARCFFYSGDVEKANFYYSKAFSLYQVHLARYRGIHSNDMSKHSGTWKEPKPTHLAREILYAFHPAWRLNFDISTELLEEVLNHCGSGKENRSKGVELQSRILGYFTLMLLSEYEEAYEWLSSLNDWLSDNPDYPFKDPGNVLLIYKRVAKAFIDVDDEKLKQAYEDLNAYMERNSILIYEINPSFDVYIYEMLREKIAEIPQ
jgi:tetratricopeptide (TPR) repeat protein